MAEEVTRIKTFNELKKFDTFEERFNYLKLSGIVGEKTFGYDRYLNQNIYNSKRWRNVRDEVIIRDNGFDLGSCDKLIIGSIIVHHMNVLTIEEIENDDDCIYDLNLLISSSRETHNAIHFGNDYDLKPKMITRKPNDTKLW